MTERKAGIYEKYIKRLLDFTLALLALIVLSPVLVVVTIISFFALGGNPFFTQERPGKDEKIFKLVKFRSMTNKTDENGNLLPDDLRLTTYGKLLRKTSIDELPELWNILKGDMSIVGPRPLLVEYLPYYTPKEKHRHDVRPGLTGLAQISGRNLVGWDRRLAFDIQYVESITLLSDLKIVLGTVSKVLNHAGVLESRITPLNEERGA